MNPERTDLYAILGLTPHATQAELSRAYRALLRQHHPDTRTVEHGQPSIAADAALQEVLTAYEVLRDPARRADYGRLRGLTARRAARQNVRLHRRHTDPTLNPPIQAGPVHWHRQPEP
jgi:curved DNA-binding protein CbpA